MRDVSSQGRALRPTAETDSSRLIEQLRAEIAVLQAGNALLRHTVARYLRMLQQARNGDD